MTTCWNRLVRARESPVRDFLNCLVVVLAAVLCPAASSAATFSDFADDFSSGLGDWILFGSPRPQWLATMKGRNGVFDNNGDSSYDSGAISRALVGGTNGFTLQSDVYLDFTNTAGCWVSPAVGLTRNANPVVGDFGENESFGLYMGLEGLGQACWMSDPTRRGHTYFNMAIFADDGTLEMFDAYASNADAYANGWHTLKIQVKPDRTVQFYIDSTLVWTPTKRLDPSMLAGRNVLLGIRSSGSAGKAYHDAVSVTTLAACNCPPTAGPYDGIWLITAPGYMAYATMNENAGQLVAVMFSMDNSYWEAYIGPRTGNTAQISALLGNVNATATITATSSTTLTGTVLTCVPKVINWSCLLKAGATFQATKIW